MSATTHTCFGYRIRQDHGAWRWTAFDRGGGVRAEGLAQSRAAAAAHVIRALAEDTLRTADRAA